ncbi:MAG: cupin domain-containing protein [Agriterribacter sp.]
MKYLYTLLLLPATIISYAQADSIPSKVYYVNELPVITDSSRYRIQILDGYTPYLSNLEAHITILEPGRSAHPPHKHANTEELIIVKEGSLKVTITGKTKILGPGGVALSMPGDIHEAVNAGKEKTSYYLLKYTKKGTDSITANTKAIPSLMVDWNEVKVLTTDRGFRREHFIQPTVLFEKFDMHATTLKQGQVSHAPHTHRQEEIILIRKGNIEMQIGNTFHKAAPGDLIFLNSGIPHALKNLGDSECEYFAFQWQ